MGFIFRIIKDKIYKNVYDKKYDFCFSIAVFLSLVVDVPRIIPYEICFFDTLEHVGIYLIYLKTGNHFKKLHQWCLVSQSFITFILNSFMNVNMWASDFVSTFFILLWWADLSRYYRYTGIWKKIRKYNSKMNSKT